MWYCENPKPNLHCAARVAGGRPARLTGHSGMPRCALRPSQRLHLTCTTAAKGTADGTRAAVAEAVSEAEAEAETEVLEGADEEAQHGVSMDAR